MSPAQSSFPVDPDAAQGSALAAAPQAASSISALLATLSDTQASPESGTAGASGGSQTFAQMLPKAPPGAGLAAAKQPGPPAVPASVNSAAVGTQPPSGGGQTGGPASGTPATGPAAYAAAPLREPSAGRAQPGSSDGGLFRRSTAVPSQKNLSLTPDSASPQVPGPPGASSVQAGLQEAALAQAQAAAAASSAGPAQTGPRPSGGEAPGKLLETGADNLPGNVHPPVAPGLAVGGGAGGRGSAPYSGLGTSPFAKPAATGIQTARAIPPPAHEAGNNGAMPNPNDGSTGRGAKFAAVDPQGGAGGMTGENGIQKKTLDTYLQQDASYDGGIGIGSANAPTAMPAATADHPSQTLGVDLSGSLQVPVAGGVQVPGATHGQPLAARAAQAVETVVSLVDAQVSRSQGSASAVRLNFNFNGNDLAVRIEMTNGVVRTQFRTDSPELRGAIASEWQAASPALQGRDLVFSAPSFSSPGGQSDAAFTSDGGASRRQQTGEPDSQAQTWSPAGFDQSPSAETAAEPAPAAIPTVRHLQTFA